MKKFPLPYAKWFFVGISVLGLGACNKMGGQHDLKTDEQKFSYVVGQQVGNGLKSQGLKVDPEILAESIGDVLNGKPSRLNPQDVQGVMMKMQSEMMQKRMSEGKENKDKADKFLAENKSKPGVKTTASGLQYTEVTAGSGAKPSATDTVKVNYKGTLLDGSEFDSSYKRGTPAEFPVNAVIKGWTEALQMMKVGSKWKLFIPPDLAYGDRSQPGIPGNSLLIFEVELLDVVAPAKTAAKPAGKKK